MEPDDSSAGVLVMRAWVEPGEAHDLRIRITGTTDGREGAPLRTIVATIDDACAVVRAWLEEFVLERP